MAGPFSSLSEHATFTLAAIGTAEALEALTARVDLERINDLDHIRHVSAAALQIAEELKHPARERWVTVNWIEEVVSRLVGRTMRLSQQGPLREETDEVGPDALKIIERDPALARKMWIGGINWCLNRAPAEVSGSSLFGIQARAVRLAELIFAPELVPGLERLARECTTTKDFRGRKAIVKYYNVRSMAAKVLTKKTGQVYTFVDVDGRTHPGGWDPSQDE